MQRANNIYMLQIDLSRDMLIRVVAANAARVGVRYQGSRSAIWYCVANAEEYPLPGTL